MFVPILMYHSIADEATAGFRRWTVKPSEFAAQLAWLRQEGFTGLTVSQFVALRDGQWPARPLVLTFDDGFADFATHAVPLLVQFGFPATLYVPSGQVGKTSAWLRDVGEGERPLLDWPDLRALPTWVEIGAHSVSHAALDRLPVQQAEWEIRQSKQALETALSRPVQSFAYPYGFYGAVERRFVREAGYAAACAVRYDYSSPHDDRWGLARQIVPHGMPMTGFADLLTGKMAWREKIFLQGRSRLWRVIRGLGNRRGTE